MTMQPPQNPVPQSPQMPGPPAPAAAIKRRNPVGVWLGLPLITLGIYTLVWIFKTHNEMDRANPHLRISAGVPLVAVLIGVLTLFIWPMVVTYQAGEHIASTQSAAGMTPTSSGALGLLLLFVFGLTPLYYQMELNKIVDG